MLAQTFDEDSREADAWPLTPKLGPEQRQNLRKGNTPLQVAISLSHTAATSALLTAGRGVWGLLVPEYVDCWPAGPLHTLGQHFADGRLTADSQQLGQLVSFFELRSGWCGGSAAAAVCLELLRAAVRQEVAVRQEDAQRALQLGVDTGSVALIHVALELGAQATTELAASRCSTSCSGTRPMQAAGGRPGRATRQRPASSPRPGAACRGLAALPQDALLHVFRLAACPLSAWVPEEE